METPNVAQKFSLESRWMRIPLYPLLPRDFSFVFAIFIRINWRSASGHDFELKMLCLFWTQQMQFKSFRYEKHLCESARAWHIPHSFVHLYKHSINENSKCAHFMILYWFGFEIYMHAKSAYKNEVIAYAWKRNLSTVDFHSIMNH